MTLEELREEYTSSLIGPKILGEVSDVVDAILYLERATFVVVGRPMFSVCLVSTESYYSCRNP